MLDGVGGDGMEHRAEDKVCDARFFRRINHLEPHLALARMSGRADMVYLVHAQHSPGDNLRLRDIADDYVGDSLGSKHLPGLRRARDGRSEERTSELQALVRISLAPFCVEKKKSTT